MLQTYGDRIRPVESVASRQNLDIARAWDADPMPANGELCLY